MTGLFARFRTWLGGLFDGGSAADDATEAAADASSPRVVHRDDRPLETPGTMERTDSRSTERGDSDATASPPGAAEPTVSIPDAEATPGGSGSDDVAPTADGDATADGRPGREGAMTTVGADANPDGDPGDDTFACSVCGTTVDDPSAPCPLCRSTDVGPVADDATEADAEAFARGGRTAVSTADDEAVDRLRDLRDGE